MPSMGHKALIKHHCYSLDLRKLTESGNKVGSNSKCSGVAVLAVNKRPRDGADTAWGVMSFNSVQPPEQKFPNCSSLRQPLPKRKKELAEWNGLCN